MLRLLVIALLLLNVLLAALQLLQPPDRAAESVVQETDRAPGVPAIRLMSELERSSGAAPGTAECFEAGPYETAEARDGFLAEVAPNAAWIGLRESEATVETGTWVLLPVQPDFVTARSMAMTLRDAGFTDADVVMDGEWKHSVTLGYFRNEANARARQQEARSLGFPAQTRPQAEQRTRYWLDFEQRTGARYLAAAETDAAGPALLRTIPCPGGQGPTQ